MTRRILHIAGRALCKTILLPVFFSSPAMAQGVDAPPVKLEGTALYSRFPESLPPSRSCKDEDLVGRLWRMISLYEQPPAADTRSLKSHPRQYLYFAKNNLYKERKIVPSANYKDGAFFRKFLYRAGDPLTQYMIHDSSYVSFYREGKVEDTRRCLIVTEKYGTFSPAEMLLVTPSKPQGEVVEVRSLRQYHPFGEQRMRYAEEQLEKNS